VTDNSGRSQAGGIITSLLIGGLVGYFIGVARAPADSSTGVNAAPTEPASSLVIHVGRGRQEASYTLFPIVLTNETGRDLGYTKVTCALYDKSGELVASAFTNWRAVAAGEKVSGEVGSRAAGIASADCRASS
jgi:hypothetical protein